MLRIEIVDSTCGEGEAYIHKVDISTDKVEILTAIAVFYPGATSILMEVED